MAKKLRVGIIGAGNIATSAHLPAYQKLTDLVEVVAIANIVPDRAKAAAEKYNIPAYFASVEELMANVDLTTSTSAPGLLHMHPYVSPLPRPVRIFCAKSLWLPLWNRVWLWKRL